MTTRHAMLMRGTITGFSVLMLTQSAAALDTKVFPGTMCVESFGADTEYNIRYTFSMAQNLDDDTRPWSCSVVRDIGSGKIEDWEVTLQRRGDLTVDWELTIWNASKDGSSGFTNTITVPKVSGKQTLSGGSANNHTLNGVYYIGTWVPPEGWLYRYAVMEE